MKLPNGVILKTLFSMSYRPVFFKNGLLLDGSVLERCRKCTIHRRLHSKPHLNFNKDDLSLKHLPHLLSCNRFIKYRSLVEAGEHFHFKRSLCKN